jgi:hypothetical protein
MSIKLETTETTTLKLLQEKVQEANNVVQAYASLLSNKYELPKDSQFTFNSDFTQIVEIPKPIAVDAQDANVVSLESRKAESVEETPVAQ